MIGFEEFALIDGCCAGVALALEGVVLLALRAWRFFSRIRGLRIRESTAVAEVQRLSGQLAVTNVQLQTERELWQAAIGELASPGRWRSQ